MNLSLTFNKTSPTLFTMKLNDLSSTEIYERLEAAEIDYDALANFANGQLGTNIRYIGDGLFEEEDAENEAEQTRRDEKNGLYGGVEDPAN